MNVKDWNLAIPQVVLVVAGGYYVYQAVIMLDGYRFDNFQTPASFVFPMLIGVILFGLAALLQEIRKYTTKKRSILFA